MEENIARFVLEGMLAKHAELAISRLALILGRDQLEQLADGIITEVTVEDEEALKKLILKYIAERHSGDFQFLNLKIGRVTAHPSEVSVQCSYTRQLYIKPEDVERANNGYRVDGSNTATEEYTELFSKDSSYCLSLGIAEVEKPDTGLRVVVV